PAGGLPRPGHPPGLPPRRRSPVGAGRGWGRGLARRGTPELVGPQRHVRPPAPPPPSPRPIAGGGRPRRARALRYGRGPPLFGEPPHVQSADPSHRTASSGGDPGAPAG